MTVTRVMTGPAGRFAAPWGAGATETAAEPETGMLSPGDAGVPEAVEDPWSSSTDSSSPAATAGDKRA
jgi:hypothetical protein